jgi:predicted phosphohydrolase
VAYGHLHGREAFRKGITGTFGGTEYTLTSADYADFSPVRIGTYMDDHDSLDARQK